MEPFFGNPNVTRQGKKARENAAKRDVNTVADPKTLAFFNGLLGEAPDQQGFSAMHPDAEGIKKAGERGFMLSLIAPFAKLTKGLPVGAATVWHGSPHKFDRFDASKIGTGEGAQAYGHGIYTAQSPGVAKQYASTLAHKAHASIVQRGSNSYDVLAPDGSVIESGVWLGKAHRAKDAFDAKQTGNLYKVDLPDPAIERMLDYDKPLSQQPAHVQAFFEPYVAPVRKVEAGTSDAAWGDLAAPRVYDPPGRELLSLLSGPKNNLDAATVLSGGTGGADTATKLRAAGIPGVRYLDGASRAGGGTSNFVVFPGEEGLLKILERNGERLFFGED